MDGEQLFRVLDERRGALRRLVRDGGTVLEAINERDGALRGLVQNSSEALEATASRDEALAETVRILPTFLDETQGDADAAWSGSRATPARWCATCSRPPTISGRPCATCATSPPTCAPRSAALDSLIRAGRTGVPALGRTVRGAGPVVDALNPFLDELNPVLSLLGFYQTRVAGFLTNGGAALQGDFGGERYAPNTVLFESRSFERFTERQELDRGHAYLPPNEFTRIQPLGGYDSPDCSRAIGTAQPLRRRAPERRARGPRPR